MRHTSVAATRRDCEEWSEALPPAQAGRGGTGQSGGEERKARRGEGRDRRLPAPCPTGLHKTSERTPPARRAQLYPERHL